MTQTKEQVEPLHYITYQRITVRNVVFFCFVFSGRDTVLHCNSSYSSVGYIFGTSMTMCV